MRNAMLALLAGVVTLFTTGGLAAVELPPSEPTYRLHYRPIAAKTAGLEENAISLNGTWRINPKPGEGVRQRPLSTAGWGDFHVPGQWVQQGYDIPQDKEAAIAKEFTIPREWAGHRVFLRFDAVHGGANYWLNGKPLGHSENLFTPVEWEITDAARPGETNRLDLRVLVATISEQRLSKMSGYAAHSLGGIPRAVTVYALPRVHVSHLWTDAGLDAAYRDGDLRVNLELDNPNPTSETGLTAFVRIYDADGKEVEHSVAKTALQPLEPRLTTVHIASRVPAPRKWNAEAPNLYKLVLELRKGDAPVESIQRNIGFRKIEIEDSQLYVNGVRVKLAGVARHEVDPLTGRADTARHAEEDVKLFKSSNLNYIRTSHYPPTREFVEACDRLGMYLGVEAPFCGANPDDSDLVKVLRPTSAMVDCCRAHPSVILWDIANESPWTKSYELSNRLVKELDPTRPTTFSGGRGTDNCDINNHHYQSMPYDAIEKDDPRPFMLGEDFFEVYHERTDVAIDPGLRELWAHGNADSTSKWGKYCIEHRARGRPVPGIYPGAWNHIYESQRCIGSVIWSAVDDMFFLPGGKIASCENSNAYWGLVDVWRRPKPELWYAKLVFSPVWFPVRRVDYTPGQASVRVPVENRYSFTNLGKLNFQSELDGVTGKLLVSLPRTSKGEIEVPIPQGTPEGKKLILRVTDGSGELVNILSLQLGRRERAPLPSPKNGAPKWHDDGKTIVIEGNGFSLALDRATGDFDVANPSHKAPVIRFPSLHVTRHDYGDLAPAKPPYAAFPDAKTRKVESVSATERNGGLELTVSDRYEGFAGATHWLIDKNGVGRVSYDYTYSGKEMDTREMGMKVLLRPECDEVKWRRWSEWGDVFPEDHISRTTGSAKARRDAAKYPETPANVKPAWPWKLDQTALGTNDFRSIKFNIYEASLVGPDGSGVRVDADADAETYVHVRPCLAKDGVRMHILSQCPLGPVVLKNGMHVAGEFVLELLCPGKSTGKPVPPSRGG